VTDWLVVDIETDGDPWSGTLVSIGVADPDGKDVFATAFQEMPDWLREALANPDVGIVEHTLYDARWLRLAGYEVNGPIADTRVMAWNLDENQDLDLDSLVFRYCQHKMDKRISQNKNRVRFKTDEGKYVPMSEVPWEDMARYNTDDARWTAALFNTLREQQPEHWERQIEFTGLLLDMVCAGVPMDMDAMDLARDTFTDSKVAIERELLADLPPDFNLNSQDQVAAYLFLKEFDLPGRLLTSEPVPPGFTATKTGRKWVHGVWKIKGLDLRPKPTAWTGSGRRPKVDAKTLAVRYGKNPWVAAYLEWQTLDKLLGTYLNALPRFIHDDRLYGTFNQAGTVSGRLSSSDPNLQNQPRRGQYGHIMRSLFAGDLVVADFSQLEPRLFAHFSEDEELLNVYIRGADIYLKTAAAIFGKMEYTVSPAEREIAKTIVLGMGYGARARKLAEILSVGGHPTTQRQAAKYLDALYHAYPRFFEWKEEVVEQAYRSGYVTTLAGRRRHITFGGDGGWRAERQAVNSVIQGSAADIVNETMLQISQIPSVQQLIQVHDEVVCEVVSEPVDIAAIQKAGEVGHGFKLSVPLVFEPVRCTTWAEGK
jgi:DNA polymerase-1